MPDTGLPLPGDYPLSVRFAGKHFDLGRFLKLAPFLCNTKNAAKDAKRSIDCRHFHALRLPMTCKVGDPLVVISSKREICKGRVSLNRQQPNSVKIAPGLERTGGLCPRSKSLSAELARVGTGFFSRIPDFAFGSDVRCAASICRATLSLPCFVDSRTNPATG